MDGAERASAQDSQDWLAQAGRGGRGAARRLDGRKPRRQGLGGRVDEPNRVTAWARDADRLAIAVRRGVAVIRVRLRQRARRLRLVVQDLREVRWRPERRGTAARRSAALEVLFDEALDPGLAVAGGSIAGLRSRSRSRKAAWKR